MVENDDRQRRMRRRADFPTASATVAARARQRHITEQRAQSGKIHISPLIYGIDGREWVVIGAKGGAPDHPAWYLDVREQRDGKFQVGAHGRRRTTPWRLQWSPSGARSPTGPGHNRL